MILLRLTIDQVAHLVAALQAYATQIVETRKREPFDTGHLATLARSHACMTAIRESLDCWSPTMTPEQIRNMKQKEAEQ